MIGTFLNLAISILFLLITTVGKSQDVSNNNDLFESVEGDTLSKFCKNLIKIKVSKNEGKYISYEARGAKLMLLTYNELILIPTSYKVTLTAFAVSQNNIRRNVAQKEFKVNNFPHADIEVYFKGKDINEHPRFSISLLDEIEIAVKNKLEFSESNLDIEINEFEIALTRENKILYRITSKEKEISDKELGRIAKPGDTLIIKNAKINILGYNNKSYEIDSRLFFKEKIGDEFSSLEKSKINVKQGQAFFTNRDYNKSLLAYNEALLNDSKNIDALIYRAETKFKLKDTIGAISDYNLALKLDTMHSYFFESRGIFWQELKEYSKAIADYGRSIFLSPQKMAISYYNRGYIYQYVFNDNERAIRDYTQALKINPSYVEALVNRGGARFKLKDFKGFKSDFTKAIEIAPENSSIYNDRGYLFLEKGRYPKAIRDFNQAIKYDSLLAYAYNNRGYAYYNLNKLDISLSDINKSLELNCNNSYAYKNRALVYLKLRQKEKSCADLKIALQNSDDLIRPEVERLIKENCK